MSTTQIAEDLNHVATLSPPGYVLLIDIYCVYHIIRQYDTSLFDFTNSRRWPSVGLMLGRCRRRRLNINQTLGKALFPQVLHFTEV